MLSIRSCKGEGSAAQPAVAQRPAAVPPAAIPATLPATALRPAAPILLAPHEMEIKEIISNQCRNFYLHNPCHAPNPQEEWAYTPTEDIPLPLLYLCQVGQWLDGN